MTTSIIEPNLIIQSLDTIIDHVTFNQKDYSFYKQTLQTLFYGEKFQTKSTEITNSATNIQPKNDYPDLLFFIDQIYAFKSVKLNHREFALEIFNRLCVLIDQLLLESKIFSNKQAIDDKKQFIQLYTPVMCFGFRNQLYNEVERLIINKIKLIDIANVVSAISLASFLEKDGTISQTLKKLPESLLKYLTIAIHNFAGMHHAPYDIASLMKITKKAFIAIQILLDDQKTIHKQFNDYLANSKVGNPDPRLLIKKIALNDYTYEQLKAIFFEHFEEISSLSLFNSILASKHYDNELSEFSRLSEIGITHLNKLFPYEWISGYDTPKAYALKEEIDKLYDERLNQTVFFNLYRAETLTPEKQKQLIIAFFQSGLDAHVNDWDSLLKAQDLTISNTAIQAYEAIKLNSTLVKQIVAGEVLFQPYLNMICSDAFDGDYTYLIVSQVKAMERYLKEILAQKFPNRILKSKINKKDRFPGYENFKNEQLTSDSLSKLNLGTTLGNLNHLVHEKLLHIPVPGFFEHDNDKYIAGWKDNIRNGFFHIHPVKTIEPNNHQELSAKTIRTETAYWLVISIRFLGHLTR